jgi:hypothetical protein
MSLDVTPLTIIDSSIQLRPWIGSSSICRRSMLPDTCVERVSTSGDSPVTVRLSLRRATFMVNVTVRAPRRHCQLVFRRGNRMNG